MQTRLFNFLLPVSEIDNRLHVGYDAFFLENKNLDVKVTVNGKAAIEIFIKKGDKKERVYAKTG